MCFRELYIDRYQHILNHLKGNSSEENTILKECKKLLIEATQAEGLDKEWCFNKLDYYLRNTFEIEIYIEE